MRITFLDGAGREFDSLAGVNLRGAFLLSANFCCTNLQRTNLRDAYLQDANLQCANLRNANLRNTDFRGADLRGAKFTPTEMLLANWGELSDSLTADCMELEASAHPNRRAFDRWAKGGPCPYSETSVQHIVNFQEKRELWGKGKLCTIYNIMTRIFAEKSVKF